MKKKIVSVLLILTMVICMMPYMAFADEPVQTEVYSVSVDFTSQKAGSFLHAPQVGYEVSSDLAESYGYPDAAGAVSVMDVLVSAHELVYGGDFTPETAEDYLTVSDGRVTKMFDYVFPAETFVNHSFATVEAEVRDGDLVEFFFLEDVDFADMYNWFTDAEGAYSRTFEVNAGEDLELCLRGLNLRNADGSYTEDAIVGSAAATSVPRAQLYAVDPGTGALTAIGWPEYSSSSKYIIYFDEPGEYWITAYGRSGCTFRQILTLTKITVTEPEPEPEPVKAYVDFTSQMSGSFLHAPKFGYEVSSDLAESYGYTDAVEGVSVLDVLAAAHELVYGENFTQETAEDYLAVSGNRVTKQFGSVFPAVFFLNRAYANDGTQGPDGRYNTVPAGAQEVQDGDLIEFFFMEDNTPGDIYNWFTGTNRRYSRSYLTFTGRNLKLTLKGYPVYYAYGFANATEMVNCNALYVNGAQIYTVDMETGALTAIDGAVTNRNGEVTLKFTEPGDHWVAAYATQGIGNTQILTLTKITVRKLIKIDPSDWKDKYTRDDFTKKDFNDIVVSGIDTSTITILTAFRVPMVK